jgi:hypothetical protein
MFQSIDTVFPCIPFLRIINGMSSPDPPGRPAFSVPWARDEERGRIDLEPWDPYQPRRGRPRKIVPSAEPQRRRNACPKPLRLEVYRRDEGICQLCGEVVPWGEATIDRVIPGSMGGRYVMDNAQLACGGCNSRKGSSLVLRFAYASKARRAVLKARGRV